MRCEQGQSVGNKTSHLKANSGSRGRQWLVPSLIGAAALGGLVLYNRKQVLKAENRYPPVGRFLDVGGVRLHYVERGQGAPVVLIHGNGSMIQDFTSSGLVDDLASRYRVIVFDRPGYGYSTRPRRLWTSRAYARLFRSALMQLNVEQAVVMGHSWGTLVAIALALEAPTLVRSLILASGYYYPTPRADVLLFSPPAIPVVGDAMRYTVSPLIASALLPKLIRRIFEPASVTEPFRRLFPFDLTLRPSQLRAAAEDTAMMIPSTMDLERHYRELTLPVTIITGADDQIVGVSRQSLRLHEALSQSEFTALPGVGHMVHHLAPDVISGLVDRMQ